MRRSRPPSTQRRSRILRLLATRYAKLLREKMRGREAVQSSAVVAERWQRYETDVGQYW